MMADYGTGLSEDRAQLSSDLTTQKIDVSDVDQQIVHPHTHTLQGEFISVTTHIMIGVVVEGYCIASGYLDLVGVY